MKKNALYFSIVLVGFIIGCSDDKKEVENNEAIHEQTQKYDTLAKDAKIFAMPAPLQIASLIKLSNAHYKEGLTIPSKEGRTFSSDYIRALNLGMYSVDVAYASVYDQRQSALNYYETLSELLKDLNFASNIAPQQISRFKANIENSDSLFVIISESFNVWQNYYQNDNREDIGLYVMAGSYIEGLHLALNSPELKMSSYFNSVIGQQKLFLDNILELSNYMDKKPDFDDLYEKLGSLQEIFLQFNVKEGVTKSGKPTIVCDYSEKDVQVLSKKVKEIRNSWLK